MAIVALSAAVTAGLARAFDAPGMSGARTAVYVAAWKLSPVLMALAIKKYDDDRYAGGCAP